MTALVDEQPLKVLSLGAGVQSTCLALMAHHGEIEKPDCAIFADTQWEPKEVYENLERLESNVTFPLYKVTEGNIRTDAQNGRWASMPLFVDNNGKEGILRRQCTNEYKIKPIRKKIQELRGGNIAELWFGISLDEVQRIKTPDVKYLIYKYPLVELNMTRRDCEKWMLKYGWGIPRRSACIVCPYKSDYEWRLLKSCNDEWQEAIDFDEQNRKRPRIDGELFVHTRRIPLSEIDLSTAEDKGQLNMFINECEGMCGI